MNRIATTQNQPEQLERLGALARLYSDAKIVLGVQFSLAILPVIAWTILLAQTPSFRSYAAVSGIVIALLDLVALEPLFRLRLRYAVQLQEEFDVAVLELIPNPLKLSDGPDRETVQSAARRYEKADPEYGKKKDWYTSSVSRLPIELARILCQRQNSWWEVRLRRTYLWCLLGVLSATLLTSLLAQLVRGASLEDFMLTVVAPGTPAIMLMLRQSREHRAGVRRCRAIKDRLTTLWTKALADGVGAGDQQLAIESRLIQDELFEHRRSSTPVFDFVYDRLHRKAQTESDSAIHSFVREAETRLGSNVASGEDSLNV